jgi:hypothetical protein
MTRYIIGFLVCISLNGIAQKSFEKNTNVIGFAGELGVYNYTSKIASNPTSKTEAAANKMLNLHYERGVLNWLGVGAKFQYSSYFTSVDTNTQTKPSVTALDFSILANGHFVRSKRVDMLAGFNIGYSHMNYAVKDAASSKATGGGLMYDLHLQPRFYFGNHFGMFINLAYVHYAYRGMDFENTYTSSSDLLDLVGGGVNFGVGFQGKF